MPGKVKNVIFDLEFKMADEQAKLNRLAKKLEDLKKKTEQAEKGSLEYAQAQRELSLVMKQLDGDTSKAEKSTSSWSKTMAKATTTLGSLVAVGTVSALFKDAVQTIGDFEQALADLSAITGATGGDLEFYANQAREIGRTTTVGAQEAVQAFQLIGSAKPELLSNKEALVDVTSAAVTLAEASGQDLPTAAANLGGALNSMRLPAEDAGRVINVLAAASQQGAREIPFVNQALEKFGGTAALAGDNIETSVAAVEVLGQTMSDASGVGTNLRNIITILRIEAQKQGREYQGLSQELGRYADKLDDVQGLTKIFGRENLEAFQNLVTGRDRLDELTTAITDTNVAYEQAEIRTSTLQGEITKLQNKYTDLTLDMRQSTGPLTRVVKFLGDNLRNIFKVITAVAAAFVGYKAGVVGVTLAQNAYKVGTVALTVAKTALRGGLRAATIQMKAFNTATKANPIGLLVGLLTTAIALLWDYGSAADDAADAQGKLNEKLEEAKRLTETTRTLEQQLAIVPNLDLRALEQLEQQLQGQADQLLGKQIEVEAVLNAKTDTEQFRAATENIRKQVAAVREEIAQEEARILEQFPGIDLNEEGIRQAFPSLQALEDRIVRIGNASDRIGVGVNAVSNAQISATGFVLPEVTNQLETVEEGLVVVRERIAQLQEAAKNKQVKGSDLVAPGTIKELQDRVKTLRKALTEDIALDSSNFEPTLARYKDAVDELATAQARLNSAQSDSLVEGSIAALQANVAELRKQVSNTNVDTAEFINLVNRLQDAQQELAQARELLNSRDPLGAQQADLQEAERHQLAMAQIMEQGEIRMLEIRVAYAKARLQVLEENGKLETDEYQKQVNQLAELQLQLENARETNVNEEIALEQQKTNVILEGIQEVITASTQALSQLISLKQQEVEQLISLQQERVNQAREVADRGNAEILQAEEERLDQLNDAREQFVRKQQALAAIQLVAESALAIAKAAAAGGPAAPFTIAATVVALAAGLAQARALASQASFYKGGYTGDGGKYEEAGTVHRGEFVIDKKTTAELGLRGMNMHQFRDMMFHRRSMPEFSRRHGVQIEQSNLSDQQVTRIVEAIDSKPVPSFKFDKRGIFTTVTRQSNKAAKFKRRAR